jgi:poly(A) polymerase
LFIRYSPGTDGGLRKKALVYVRKEHGIDRSAIDPDALRIMERLRSQGHGAYVVGGAVRDLLIGRKPKDFDIVTDATPGRIKKLFWNARIIGKRFRLVHIFFDRMIYEVATFRSLRDGSVGNEYGTMDEDVLRRDFTMNALYYDPRDETVVDYVGGMEDIRKRRVRALIPLKRIFDEDPVRMVRAAKYAASTGFSIPFALRMAIRSKAGILGGVSVSRLSEEISKILASGKARQIIDNLVSLRLLPQVLPEVARRMKSAAFRVGLKASLEGLDAFVASGEESRLGKQLSFLLETLLENEVDWSLDPLEAYSAALGAAKDALSPMNLPRVELENAVRYVFRARGVPLLQKHLRQHEEERRPARRRGRRREQGGREGGDGREGKEDGRAG